MEQPSSFSESSFPAVRTLEAAGMKFVMYRPGFAPDEQSVLLVGEEDGGYSLWVRNEGIGDTPLCYFILFEDKLYELLVVYNKGRTYVSEQECL